MVAYTGIETVSNMAEEARDPGHDVPKAVNLVVLAVLGVYAGISVVALSALPVVHHGVGYSHALGEQLRHPGYATALGGSSKTTPCSGIVSRLGLHGTVLTIAQYYVGVLAATILFIATNAGLIGISRLSWSLAEHRQLPSLFSQLHPRYRTPWFTIVFFSVLAGAADPARRHRRCSATSTRSARCSRSRPRTSRSSRCASRSPTASGPTGCRGTCASAATRSR